MKGNIIVLLVFLCSCNTQLKDKDLVGLWKAKDGAVIELYSNGLYAADNIDFGKIKYPKVEFSDKKLSLRGNWRIDIASKKVEFESKSTYADYGISNTYTYNGERKSHEIGMSFNIEGSGMSKNSQPWMLFVFVGDPDDLNKYVFIKQDD